ncbi:MAG: exopolysaccharide biosynthesis protein [Rhizobiaceae bacterium]|nr:exopolysaccharide biosynthesis protein [Rhizobiaceae bacterium]
MPDQHDLDSMEVVLDTIADAGDGKRVSVEDIVHEIGDDAFGPLMLIPALVAVTPASGIPGLTATCGLIIALVAFQMVIGRKALWLPGFLLRRTMPRAKLDTARDWLARPARIVDRLTGKRLSFLVKPPFSVIPATICLAAGLVMPFLELIPFSGSVMAGAVSLFALSFVTEDGILSVLATALVATAGYLAWTAMV